MGIIKLVAAGAAGLGLVGVGYAGLAGQDDTKRDASGAVVEGGELGAFRIRVGDCFNDVAQGAFESVTAIPCSEPHVYEVYAAFFVNGDSDAPYPGDTTLASDADSGCVDRFEGFVGTSFERSIYDGQSITPTRESWEQLDDREILCVLSGA